MGGQIRMRHRFRQYIGKWFDYLFVSKEEMKEILKETGWKLKKSIESQHSQYIAIIEKHKPNSGKFAFSSDIHFT